MQPTIYRPTVRMDTAFQEYINDCFHSTTADLDRNKIIRMMLFSAPHSALFLDTIKPMLRGDVLPLPSWTRYDHELWRGQTWERGEEVNDGARYDCRPIGLGQIFVRVGGMDYKC